MTKTIAADAGWTWRQWGLAVMAAALLWAPATGKAQQLERIRHLIDQGQYETAAGQARTIAHSDASADAWAWASRSLLLNGAYHPDPQHQAMSLGEVELCATRALELDPNNALAHLQLSAVFGIQAKESRSLGQAKKARNHIERAIEIDPEDAWAHATYGVWNADVRRAAGGFGAKLAGASYEQSEESFARAMALEPDNPVFPVWYGFTLLKRDPFDKDGRARAMLHKAVALEARSEYERTLQAQAMSLLGSVDLRDKKSVTAQLDDYQPFKGVIGDEG